jgi:PAS domain S-box-containing protein
MWGTAVLLVLAGIATLLVVLGPAAPPQGGPLARALAVGGIWLVAGLAILLVAEREALRSARAELRAAAGASSRTEAQLREQEARLRSIIDTVPESLITIGETGIVESFSRSAEVLFGYAAAEVVGRNVSTLMPEPFRSEHDGYLARYQATGERRIIGIGRVVKAKRKDGTVFPIELSVGEAALPGGKRLFTGFVRDLTARERMEEDLRQAQKMEAVGQLTGGIAHDFNNLLTVILGNLEMLEARLEGDDRQRTLLREAEETARLGAQLTDRLLAFGRRQPLDPRLVDVGRLVADMSVLLQRTLGETVEVRSVIAMEGALSLVDPAQLQNAVLNLALNARDAMPEGGMLTIEVTRTELDADYAQMHSEVRAGRYLVLAVTDTGRGMSAEVRERAFEPFFTTKGVGAGSGLGLSMVYGFVKQSGGQVQLYSEVGHGTTVRLFLPLAGEEAGREEGQAPALAAFRSRGETILVVEDEARVRRVSVARLLDLGYRVLEAGDGPAALAMLQRHSEIDLLFTDLVMPGGMTGRELAEEAQRRRDGLKVLFTSGYAQPEMVRRGLPPRGAWLKKPYTAAELAAVLREVLDRGMRGEVGQSSSTSGVKM